MHTSGLTAMVSSWSALLSSFEEVRQVLCDHGLHLDVKVIRKVTYNYTERARAIQRAGIDGYSMASAGLFSLLTRETRNPSTFHQILIFVSKNQDVRY